MTEENLLNADIPEKFKDPETGAVNVDMMAKSYKALEHKLSAMPSAPATHEEYCIECKHGVVQPDPEVNRRLHEKGLTQEQAQAVYDLAEEKMIPLIQKMAADYKADREVEKLIAHFGSAEKWKVMARQLYAFGSKNLPADVLDNMASSFEGVIALHSMMKGDEPMMQKGTGRKSTLAGDEAELSSMMRDPRYWKHKDPAFVAKVTQGFQNLYGE